MASFRGQTGPAVPGTLLCIFLLRAQAVPKAPPQQPPDAKEVAARLKEAIGGDDPGAAASALDEVGHTADKAVVQAVAKGLEHKDPVVRAAALQALRFNRHESALDALLRARRSKLLLAEPAEAAEYFYALGQKADPRILPVLAEGPRGGEKDDPALRARLLAIGRVRTRAAVETLMAIMTATGGRRGHPYMRELRLSLLVLTGVDKGPETLEWIHWWDESRKTLEVSAVVPPLPKDVADEWKRLWADPFAEPEDAVEQALGGLGGAASGSGTSRPP